MNGRPLTLVALLLLANPIHATGELAEQSPVADAIALLDLWIEEQRTYRDLPGLSIGVVHDQELVWAKGYGTSDLETEAPVTPETVFRVGSITKLFTATAIMQLRDAGKLRLDDPVSTHLPWFEVKSSFEDEPEITVRHLLTHTSGLPRDAAFPQWTTHDFPTRDQVREALPGQDAIFPRRASTNTRIWEWQFWERSWPRSPVSRGPNISSDMSLDL